MNQDSGTYSVSRSDGEFLLPRHPIFRGVDVFDGEGVSPIVVEHPVPAYRLRFWRMQKDKRG